MSKLSKALDKARWENELGEEQQWEEQEFAATQLNPQIQFNKKITCVQEPRQSHLEANRVLSALPDQGLIDTYNLLRTQLLHKTRENGWNAIMVTSALPGEGKSTTAINLGLSIAREAMQTALVVDTNLRYPSLDRILDLNCTKGLSDYLLEDANLSQLLINPSQDKFVVLPAGRAIEGSTDILGSPKMKQLVQELKSRYPDRYVLFDGPHVLDMPDSLIFASYVDAVLLVVEAGKTHQDKINAALETLQDNNLVGMVLNKKSQG
jgi:exopolysaccharide/PEP-CTERM locus tyrosine autokinase